MAGNSREPALAPENVKVMENLSVDPELGRGAKALCQAIGGISGNCPFAVYDLVDPARRHINLLGQPVFGDAKRLQEFLGEHLAGSHKR